MRLADKFLLWVLSACLCYYHMDNSNNTRGSFAKGTQKGKKHIGYDQSQHRAYLEDFITNYHSLNATKCCREKGLSRQIFRGWWANREQILDERNTFSPKRKLDITYPMFVSMNHQSYYVLMIV